MSAHTTLWHKARRSLLRGVAVGVLVTLGIAGAAPAGALSIFGGFSSDAGDYHAPVPVSPTVDNNRSNTDDSDMQALDGSHDNSRLLYHSQDNWEWLKTPSAVHPGARIVNTRTNRTCTVGWIAEHDQGVYAIVAGHCGNAGDRFTITTDDGNQKTIGSMTNTEFINGQKDFGFIGVLPGVDYRSAVASRGKLLRMVDGEPENRDPELIPHETRVCLLGATSGLSCGPYLFRDSSGLEHFYAQVGHGDSGAPVFTIDGSQIIPVGIISGAARPGLSDITVQPLRAFMDRYSLTFADD